MKRLHYDYPGVNFRFSIRLRISRILEFGGASLVGVLVWVRVWLGFWLCEFDWGFGYVTLVWDFGCESFVGVPVTRF